VILTLVTSTGLPSLSEAHTCALSNIAHRSGRQLMHLFLDLVRPNGERVVYSGERQPRFRQGSYFGFVFRVVGSFRSFQKDQGACSAMFHGVPPNGLTTIN
jgi:hypothetical protein